MGQNVTVVEKKSSNPRLLRFELNRSLTGMGHERYSSVEAIVDDRVVDQLARRLFEAGGVDSVHVNSSVVTVQLGGGSTGEGLLDVIRNMFRFYGDEAPAEDAPSDDGSSEGTVADGPVADGPVADGPAADGPPTDEVAEPDAASAPESAVDRETAREATLADADDAPKETETSSAVE